MVDAISKTKIDDLETRFTALGVHKSDLVEEFIRGSGSGGQKINKTNSCVQLTHLPTGIVIKCQQTRSRENNRFFARRLLVEKLETLKLGKESAKAKQIHKIRAQKKKRSKRAREKMLGEKHHRGEIKTMRSRPRPDGD